MCGTFCFLCQIHQNAEALGQPGEDTINFDFLKTLLTMVVRHLVLFSGLGPTLRPAHAAQREGQSEIQHRGQNDDIWIISYQLPERF